MSHHGPTAKSLHWGRIYSGAFHHLFVILSLLIQSSHHSPSPRETQLPRMTDQNLSQNLSKVDRNPSEQEVNSKFALASIAALFIHFSWPSGPLSYSDGFDWIWLLWKVPVLLSFLYPYSMLLLWGEIEFSYLFSYSGHHTSGLKIKRTSTDQTREDRNFLAILITAVISALLVTVDAANLLFAFLNWTRPVLEVEVLRNFVASVNTLSFLLLVFMTWVPVMNFLSWRQDVPSAQKPQNLFDAGMRDGDLRVTDLIAMVEKYERTQSKIGTRQATIQEILTELRSERDSDTPTSG